MTGTPPVPPSILLADGLVEVVPVDLDADPRSGPELVGLLAAEERGRAERFIFERDRRRYVVGRARLRELLAARLDRAAPELEFTRGPQGKPGLVDTGLGFNLSHCEGLALYAFTTAGEIGIDVEALREPKRMDAVAARCFSATELDAWRRLDPADRMQGFHNCWTRKEAFIKARGGGLFQGLRDFDVSLAPAEPARVLRVDGEPDAGRRWRIDSFCPAPGFVAAVVTDLGGVASDAAR